MDCCRAAPELLSASINSEQLAAPPPLMPPPMPPMPPLGSGMSIWCGSRLVVPYRLVALSIVLASLTASTMGIPTIAAETSVPCLSVQCPVLAVAGTCSGIVVAGKDDDMRWLTKICLNYTLNMSTWLPLCLYNLSRDASASPTVATMSTLDLGLRLCLGVRLGAQQSGRER